MKNNFIFQNENYISDYESETRSEGDNLSEIGYFEYNINKSSNSDVYPLRDKDLLEKPKVILPARGNSKAIFDAEHKKVHNAIVRQQLLSLDAYDRHKKLVNNYLQYYGGSWKDFARDTSKDKTDIDVIRDHGRFLWSEKDEPTSWSERLAKKYWDKLFKEYCLVDLSRYRENKFGMRWRLEKEVISGKGQFTCGSVSCSAGSEVRLRSWEVNFSYKEHGERRNAFVKLRLCPVCSNKLNYQYRRQDVTGKRLQIDIQQKSTKDDSRSSLDNEIDLPAKRLRLNQSTNDELGKSKVVSLSSSSSSSSSSVWSNTISRSADPSACLNVIKSQEDEFDEYFADMLV